MKDKRWRASKPLPTPGPASAKQWEAMMHDEIFDREYQAGREALNDGIDRLVAGIGQTFKLMAAIQFNAPWQRSARGKCGPAI